jgi:hypothetical protein
VLENVGSPGRIRTSDQPVNSRFGVAPASALGYNLSKLAKLGLITGGFAQRKAGIAATA